MFIDPNKPLPIPDEKKDKLGSVLNAMIEIGRTEKEVGTSPEAAEVIVNQQKEIVNAKLDQFEQDLSSRLKVHSDKKGPVHGESKKTVALEKVDNWRMGTQEEQELGQAGDVYCNPKGLHKLVAKALAVDPTNYIRSGIIPIAQGGMLGNVIQWSYPFLQGEAVESPNPAITYMADTPWMFDTENGIDIYPVVNGSRVLTQSVADEGQPKRAFTSFGGTTLRVYPNTIDIRRKRPGHLRGWSNEEPNNELLRASAHLFDRNAVYYMEGPSVGVRSFNKNRLQFDVLKGEQGRVENWKGIMESRENLVYNLVSDTFIGDLGWGDDVYLVLDMDIFTVTQPGMDAREGAGRPAETRSRIETQFSTINYSIPGGVNIHVVKRAGKRDAIAIKMGDLLNFTPEQKARIIPFMNTERSKLMAFAWLNRLRGDMMIRIPLGYWNEDKSKYVNYYIDIAYRVIDDQASKTATVTVTPLRDITTPRQTLGDDLLPMQEGRFVIWPGSVADNYFHPLMFDGIFSQLGGHVKVYTYYNRQYVINYKHNVSTVRELINLPVNQQPALERWNHQEMSTYNGDGFYGDHLRHIPIHIDNERIHYAVYSRDWQNKYRWSIAVVERDNIADPVLPTGTHLGPWRESLRWIRQDIKPVESTLIYNVPSTNQIETNGLVFNSMNEFKGHANFTYTTNEENNPIEFINPVELDDSILTWLGQNGGGWTKNIRQLFLFRNKLFWFSQTTDASEIKEDGTDCYYGYITGAFVDVQGDKRTVKISGSISGNAVVNHLKVNTAESLKINPNTITGYDAFESSDVYIMKTKNGNDEFRIMVNLGPFNNFYFHFNLIDDGTGVEFEPATDVKDPVHAFDPATNGFNVDYDKLNGFGVFAAHRFHVNYQTPVMHNKSMWSMCRTPGNYVFTTEDREWVVTGGVMTNIEGVNIYPVGSVSTISGGNAVVKKPISAKKNEYTNPDELFVRLEGDGHVLYGKGHNPSGYPTEPHSGAAPVGFLKDEVFYHYDPDGWRNALLPVVDGYRMNFYGYGSSIPALLGVYGEEKPINRFFLLTVPTTYKWNPQYGRAIPVRDATSITVNGNTEGYDGSGMFIIPDKYTDQVVVEITGLTQCKWNPGMQEIVSLGNSVTSLDFKNSSMFYITAALPRSVTSFESIFQGAQSPTYPGLENWDVSNITTFGGCFDGAKVFNQDLSKWRTTSAVNMDQMFQGCLAFEQNLNDWDVSNVRSMASMFESSGRVISKFDKWNVGRVQSFRRMFAFCEVITPEMSHWNTSSVTDMDQMFIASKCHDLNLSNWDVSNVISAIGTFDSGNYTGDSLLNMSNWKFKSLRNGYRMFFNSNFNGNVDNWEFSSNCELAEMFRQCTRFNHPINTWKVNGVTTVQGMFRDTKEFNSSAGNLHWDSCVDFSYMFENSVFAGDISGWTFATGRFATQGIKMNQMFQKNLVFNSGGIEGWNVDNVIDMESMFNTAKSFNRVLNGWRPGRCTNFSFMFSEATVFNTPIRDWDTKSVQTMQFMFYKAGVFNQDITRWNTSSVLTMEGMFYGASEFNQPIGSWDVSKVISFANMFNSAIKFDKDIGAWNVSSAVSLEAMFGYANNYNQSMADWNVGNVTNMRAMFEGCVNLNQAFARWNVSKVTDMFRMFKGTTNFSPTGGAGLENWDVSSVTTCEEMFNRSGFNSSVDNWSFGPECTLRGMFRDAINFNRDIVGWDTSKVSSIRWLFRDCKSFNAVIDQLNLTNCTDADEAFYGATNFNGHLPSWNFEGNKQVSLYGMFKECKSYIGLGLWNWKVGNCRTFAEMFVGCSVLEADLSAWDVSSGQNFSDMFRGCAVYNKPMYNWNVSNASLMSNMFRGCTAFNQGLDSWRPSKCREFYDMFNGCVSFNSEVENWDVSSGELFNGMFVGCTVFNRPIGNWNVGNGRIFTAMFQSCRDFNQDLTNWDMSKATITRDMFNLAGNFNGNVVGWNVSNVTDFNNMFADATNFNQPIGGWNVGSATTLATMFWHARVFNQDISNWDTSKTTHMNGMFSGAWAFNQDLSRWNVSNVVDHSWFDDETPAWTLPRPNFPS